VIILIESRVVQCFQVRRSTSISIQPRVGSLTMDALISLMNHPYLTMKLASSDDSTRHIHAVYPLSIFFAFGIYLVFQRYQIKYNTAVPFEVLIPDVWPVTSFA
jgi:hypothetical protein